MTQLSSDFYDIVYGSYLQVSDKLHGPDGFTRKPQYTRDLFEYLNISWSRWPRAVIVGSKGKGSTAIILSSILAAGGERVGTVTSPHLVSFTERIRVDGENVTHEELEYAASLIAPGVRAIRKRISSPDYIGPGGIILAIAWQIFRLRDVTTVVVEAGRGGEFDEAGCIDPQVTVITPIMGEHTRNLGRSLTAITQTKARIAPMGSTIVSAKQHSIVEGTILKVAERRNCKLFFVNAKTGLHGRYSNTYREQNGMLAGLAATRLREYGASVNEAGFTEGIQRVILYGRLQIIHETPLVVLDGTINRIAARYVREFIKKYSGKIIPVIAIPRPKDLKGVLEEISKLSDQVILTELACPQHIAWYRNATELAEKYFAKVRLIKPSENAYKTAVEEADSDAAVLLLGTQVFVGNALAYWNISPSKVW